MIRCFLLKRGLHLHAQGLLAPKQGKKVRAHLENCASCRRRLAEMKKITVLAENSAPPFLGEVFWRKFDERLELRLQQEALPKEKPRLSPRFAPRLRPALSLAAAAAVILGVLLTLRTQIFRGPAELVLDEEQLLEISLMLDAAEGPALNHDIDAYIDEALLLMELGQA